MDDEDQSGNARLGCPRSSRANGCCLSEPKISNAAGFSGISANLLRKNATGCQTQNKGVQSIDQD